MAISLERVIMTLVILILCQFFIFYEGRKLCNPVLPASESKYLATKPLGQHRGCATDGGDDVEDTARSYDARWQWLK